MVGTVRNFSYDRFPIVSFKLQKSTNKRLTVQNNTFRITKGTTTSAPSLFSQTFSDDSTFEELTDGLINAGFPLATTGRYRFDEFTKDEIVPIIPDDMVVENMKEEVPIFSKYFYSNKSIKNFIHQYFYRVYGKKTFADDAEMDLFIQTLEPIEYRHLQLFTAIMIVEFRRFSEYANVLFGGEIYSDGSGELLRGDIGTQYSGDSIDVSIGTVFNLRDNLDDSRDNNKFDKDLSLPGSSNPIGDDGFWYRLWVWLISMLEDEYKDYSFRRETGMWGLVTLTKDLNYRAYFDSFPFTLSPFERGIR